MADASTKVVAVTTTPGQVALPGGGLSQMWKVFDSELLNGTATVDSLGPLAGNGIAIPAGAFFGLHIIGTPSSGTAAYTVSLLQSWDDTAANYVVPDANGVQGSSASTAYQVSNNNAHVIGITPTPMPFLRIRVIGTGANPATTRLTAYLWMVR